MVSSMKSQISILEIKVSGKPVQEKNQFDENTKQSIAEVLKNTEIIMESINSEHSAPNISIPKGPFRFNAANYLNGASVDTAHSSSSNLNTFIGLDQTNLVLLDRPQPPNDKAWCTNEHTPVLTLNLAKPIKPISVSYQHSKWQGIVPKETPRTYDVVACLDFNCENWKPLVSNCEYNQFGFNGNEQFCNISSHVPLIEKVQFRFTQNYGDLKMTCVNLVRVYGETEAPLKYENKKDCESEKICKDLKRFYHSYSPEYALRNTTCAFLYENDCCSRCPECCEECVITEYNSTTVTIVVWTICAFFFFLFFSPCGLLSNRFAKPPVE
ncbi:hypothetical protein B9Z55_020949 [Caenorhabditis nigoni]|uniref:SUN domain-containing protein n=1 Tax=Caenorhabditis nigoni TaxID=1611254 RepID=A0A2G5TPX3_9PELO|nr:hypothetical protein B9Z55_020949 [Caenorhabditis nigoni]